MRPKHKDKTEPLPKRARGTHGELNLPLTEVERFRAMARFRCMRSPGGVEIGFSAMGPSVPAAIPEELAEATHAGLEKASSKQQPN